MIEELQEAMLKESQEDLLTLHNFTDNMYARTIVVPANVCLVGAKHKTNHFLIISKGSGWIITNEGEPEHYSAPKMIESKAGDKRVIYAEHDTILTTFHVTDETDIDKIGELILESEPNIKLPQWKQKALGGVH